MALREEGARAEALQAEADRLLRLLGLENSELSLVVCDDGFMQHLNKTWRGVDAPTDVLSFAMGEGEAASVNPDVLGDVVIAMPTAQRQALEQGHDVETELRVLLVHGVLHVLGYDHVEPEDAEEMRAAEAKLLAALGQPGPGLITRAGA